MRIWDQGPHHGTTNSTPMATDTPKTDTPTPSFPPLKLEWRGGKITFVPKKALGRLYVSIETSSYDFNEEANYAASMDELKQIRDWADSLLQDNEQEGH